MKKIMVDRGTELDSKLGEVDSHPLTETEKGIMIIRLQRAILSLSIEHTTLKIRLWNAEATLQQRELLEQIKLKQK